MRLVLTLLLAATALPGAATERIAVLAVHDPPAPDGELTELTHQLRAASQERIAGVLTAPEMRDRLAGKSGGATAQELDRAFGGALAVYQNGEYESAARTLRAIIEDLEELPQGEAVWSQWTRAMMRLSHVHLSMKQPDEVEAVQVALLKVDSTHQLDPVLYAPGFRAKFEEVRQRVRAMPKRRLTITSRGRAGTIYVSGRDVGPTPATVILPAGSYRVSGASGALRIPSFTVDLSAEDRAVVLDFALAETFRPGAGPGMVLPAAERAAAIIRAGAWLGVEKLVVASRGSEGGALFLVGAIYDVRRGALLREGSVRLVSGAVPSANLGALASFLLTGQSSREVQDRTREPQSAKVAPPRRPGAAPPVSSTVVAQALPPSSGPAPAAAAPALAPAPAALAPPPPPQVTFIPAVAASTGPSPRLPSQPPPSAPPSLGEPAKAVVSAPPPAAPVAAPPTPTAPPTGAPASAPPVAARTAPPPSRPASNPATAPAAKAPSATAPPTVVAEGPRPTPDASPDLHPVLPVVDPVARALAEPPARPPAWRRPASLGAGALAAVLGGVALHQGLAARRAFAQADAMVLPGGLYQPPHTRIDHAEAIARGDDANRNAWLAASGALLSATTGAALYWFSREPALPR